MSKHGWPLKPSSPLPHRALQGCMVLSPGYITMAAPELSDPSEQFTSIKELSVTLEKELEEVDRVPRVQALQSAGEPEPTGNHELLQALLLEGRLELVATPAEDDKHILSLRAVPSPSGDPGLLSTGWLDTEHVQELQVAEGVLPLLWLGEEPQQSLQPCVALGLQEELSPLQELEVMKVRVLEESQAVVRGDPEPAPNLSENSGLTKVLLLHTRAYTRRHEIKVLKFCLCAIYLEKQFCSLKLNTGKRKLPRKTLRCYFLKQF